MGLTSLVLRFAAPLPDIENFSRYMFIGPHPDDIEIGAGATAAKLAAAGKAVCFVICTDGRFGDANSSGASRDELVQLRRQEALASAAALGIEQVIFLNFSDGGFYKQEDLIKALAAEIGRFKPDVIFAPDPCVSSECHADHLNVGNAAKQLAYFAPYSGIMEGYGAESSDVQLLALYMTAKPNSFVKTKGFVEKQLDAIFNKHLSQFPLGCNDAKTISLYIKLRAFEFGVRSLSGKAEGFRTLDKTHMHCLPEAEK